MQTRVKSGAPQAPGNFFTGDVRGGNPFKQSHAGVAYDRYEVHYPLVDSSGVFPVLGTPYRNGARRLVGFLIPVSMGAFWI